MIVTDGLLDSFKVLHTSTGTKATTDIEVNHPRTARHRAEKGTWGEA